MRLRVARQLAIMYLSKDSAHTQTASHSTQQQHVACYNCCWSPNALGKRHQSAWADMNMYKGKHELHFQQLFCCQPTSSTAHPTPNKAGQHGSCCRSQTLKSTQHTWQPLTAFELKQIPQEPLSTAPNTQSHSTGTLQHTPPQGKPQ